MDARTIRAHATEQVLLDRIDELLRYREWYRAHPWTIDWPSRQNDAIELRALVRLARKARRLAAKAPDPVTTAKAEADRHADCECHYINRQGDREYPSDYFDGDHYVYERAAS